MDLRKAVVRVTAKPKHRDSDRGLGGRTRLDSGCISSALHSLRSICNQESICALCISGSVTRIWNLPCAI